MGWWEPARLEDGVTRRKGPAGACKVRRQYYQIVSEGRDRQEPLGLEDSVII